MATAEDSDSRAAMDEEDGDQLTRLNSGDRSQTFSPPLQRPTFQPWTRQNTGVGTSGFQRTSSAEPLLRKQRSRQFSKTSVDADSILLDRPASSRRNTTNDETEDSTEQWHSIAIIFVALPAIAGMFFENGSAVVTDMLMLGLGCLFLYWSVKWPWQWYYSTQELKLADVDPNAEFAMYEDSDVDELDSGSQAADTDASLQHNSPTSPSEVNKAPSKYPSRADQKRASATQALQSLEIMALTSCFLSPGAVAYMLHSIRPYLSRPSGGVVSNSNLTLFVLAAELRPILHFFRLVEERTLHLQRIVSSLPASEEKQLEDRVLDLTKRIEDFESTKSSQPQSTISADKQDLSTSSPTTSSDLERNLRSTLQPQLDALNRAVRRYEKRATTQAIVTEARLRDLESRLKDALSLAAAASRQATMKGNSGLLQQVSDVVKWALTRPFEVMLLPVKIAGEAWRFLFGGRRKKRKGGDVNGMGTGGSIGAEGKKWASEFRGKRP